jgi:soluble lytic murein transglycosylase-like protein
MVRATLRCACWLLAASAAAAEIRVEVGPDGRKVMTNAPGRRAAAASPAAIPRAPAAARRVVAISARRLAEVVEAEAAANAVDPDLVRAVIRVESGYDPAALSRKGAIGLMQLMPSTAAVLDVDPWDPEENVAGGTRYLRQMLDRFGELELALAGYNAGPEAVERYAGVPPYDETREYVRRVLASYAGLPVYELAPAPEIGRKVRVARDGRGRLVLTTDPAY